MNNSLAADAVIVLEHLKTNARRRIVDPLIAQVAATMALNFSAQAAGLHYANGHLLLPASILPSFQLLYDEAYQAGRTVGVEQFGFTVASQDAPYRAGQLAAHIDNTTRNELDAMIATGKAEGWTDATIEREARAMLTADATTRAESIAEYEVSSAYHEGLSDYVQSLVNAGVVVSVQKRWSADPDACEECQSNAADGWIDEEINFASGSSEPPEHPACRCSVDYREH